MSHTFSGPDWLSPRIPHWQNMLASLRGKTGLRCLEIGCFEGRTSCWLLENILTANDASITCVDLFELTPQFLEETRRQGMSIPSDLSMETSFDTAVNDVKNKVEKHKGDAKSILQQLAKKQYDLIILDASQKSRDVLTYAIHSFDLLPMHGLLCLCMPTFTEPSLDPLAEPRKGAMAFCQNFRQEADILETDGKDIWIRRKPLDTNLAQVL